jgi:soluble lytic murein transglycosylase-like protein
MHWLRFSIAVFGIVACAACRADGGIYAFVDGDEVHLSNVPDDDRYEIVLAAPAMPATADADAPLASAPAVRLQSTLARPYGAEVAQAADRYGLEAALLHAVISVESAYNARAVSKRGAAGLMQLMPQTARRYGVANVFDPAENVRAGAQYLSDLLKLFGNNLRLALAAYNAGEGAVLKYGRNIPPFKETVAYVPKVFEFYERLRAM